MHNQYYKIYDFLSWSRVVFFISIFLFFISCITMIVRGFNWGLDFTGGVLIEIILEQDINIVDIQNILVKSGYKQSVVQCLNSSKNIIIRLPLDTDTHLNKVNLNVKNNILQILQHGITQKFVVEQINWVGPSISDRLVYTGIAAMLVALVCILIYITFRFEWRLAVGIVVSLIHDIIIILGILSLIRVEIDATIVAALMSAIGYSINDKIVIFDRIRENFCRTFFVLQSVEVFNISLSQVLNRTIITSITTIMVMFVLFIFGGTMLHGFATVLLLGSIIGTVSSIYIASALAYKLGTTRNHFIPIKKN